MADLARRIGGRYRLQHRLGEGGMASVYAALDEKLQRRVAVKLLHAHLARNAEVRSRFRLEAQAVSALDHPNVVRVYDYSGSRSKELWLVTELVEGRTLAQILRENGTPHPVVGLCIAREVCKALQEAHARGLVHRDVKPENVMITHQGRLKLMDFGIAKDMRHQSMTQAGSFMGSPSYMSPEQVKGQDVDVRTDIYSLGVVMYELATGVLPFVGSSTHEIILKIVEGRYLAPRDINVSLPIAMDRMVRRCLGRSPSDRYGSTSELAREMDHSLVGLGFAESHVELERYYRDRSAFEARLAQLSMGGHRSGIPSPLPRDRTRRQRRDRGFPAVAKTARNIPALAALQRMGRVSIPRRGKSLGSYGPSGQVQAATPLATPSFYSRPESVAAAVGGWGLWAVAAIFAISILGFVMLGTRLGSDARRWSSATNLPSGTAKDPSPRQGERSSNASKALASPGSPAGDSTSAASTQIPSGRPVLPSALVGPGPSEGRARGATDGAAAPNLPLPAAAARQVSHGYFQIGSRPAAELWVNGVPRGTTVDATYSTPWIRIQPGRHRLELRRPGYETFLTHISVESGARIRVPDVALVRKAGVSRQSSNGTLTIEVDRTPAEVSIVPLAGGGGERRLTVKARRTDLQLQAGSYRVTVAQGGRVRERVLVVSAADDEPMVFDATSTESP